MPNGGLRINGEALRTIRERSGLSGTELAAIVDINRAYLSHIEAGRRFPSGAVARRLADALKCPLVAILASPEQVA